MFAALPTGTPVPSSTVDRRVFGTTDDAAIFIDDTLDHTTIRCVSNSPSAVAILSPQRLPPSASQHRNTDACDFDALLGCGYVAGMSSSAKKKPKRHFAADVTNHNHSGTQFGIATSLFPRSADDATPVGVKGGGGGGVLRPSGSSGTQLDAACATSPSLSAPPPGYVPMAEWERCERERHRFQKMYEHQKTLYEEMSATQQETYQSLQDKIVEVVALSTRNEESKRFIRQLKKEMLESRSRALEYHNRQWNDDGTRSDRVSQEQLRNLLQQQEQQFTSVLRQQESKMAGLEGLVRDLTVLRTETEDAHGGAQSQSQFAAELRPFNTQRGSASHGVGDGGSRTLQISQLDHLLKASYAKNAALFGDLIRQGRQLELVTERKQEVERQLDALRREKREMESALASERRQMNFQLEQCFTQIKEQQQKILELRQCLVRTMASPPDSCSSGEDEHEEEDEEEEDSEENDNESDPRRERTMTLIDQKCIQRTPDQYRADRTADSAPMPGLLVGQTTSGDEDKDSNSRPRTAQPWEVPLPPGSGTHATGTPATPFSGVSSQGQYRHRQSYFCPTPEQPEDETPPHARRIPSGYRAAAVPPPTALNGSAPTTVPVRPLRRMRAVPASATE